MKNWPAARRRPAGEHRVAIARCFQRIAQLLATVAAGALLVAIGVADDRRGLSTWLRLGGQVGAACVVMACGVTMTCLPPGLAGRTGGIALGLLALILKTKGALGRLDKYFAFALAVIFFVGGDGVDGVGAARPGVAVLDFGFRGIHLMHVGTISEQRPGALGSGPPVALVARGVCRRKTTSAGKDSAAAPGRSLSLDLGSRHSERGIHGRFFGGPWRPRDRIRVAGASRVLRVSSGAGSPECRS
jgi:hypothetical protein